MYVLFLINIPKIAVSAKRSVIRHSSLSFVLKLHFITQQFLLVGLHGLVLSPGTGTLATLLKPRKLCNYMELSKLDFASSLSRKDERIAKSAFSPQGRRVCIPVFFLHYMPGVGEGFCEYPLVICR